MLDVINDRSNHHGMNIWKADKAKSIQLKA